MNYVRIKLLLSTNVLTHWFFGYYKNNNNKRNIFILHRLHGPAAIWDDGIVCYAIDGYKTTLQDTWKEMRRSKYGF